MKSAESRNTTVSNTLSLNELAGVAMVTLRPVLRLAAAVAVAALLSAGSADAATLHVSTSTGVDSPTCGAQGAPCKNINQAVKIAGSGDFIKMAAGTYTYVDVQTGCGSTVGSPAR